MEIQWIITSDSRSEYLWEVGGKQEEAFWSSATAPISWQDNINRELGRTLVYLEIYRAEATLPQQEMNELCLFSPALQDFVKIKSQKKECDWPGVGTITITQRKRRHFESTLQKQIGMPPSLNTVNVLFSRLDSVSLLWRVLQEAKRNHWRILNTGIIWLALCLKTITVRNRVKRRIGREVVRVCFNSWGKNTYLKI